MYPILTYRAVHNTTPGEVTYKADGIPPSYTGHMPGENIVLLLQGKEYGNLQIVFNLELK